MASGDATITARMSRPTKPYRRFRARGRGGDDGKDPLEALRRLNADEPEPQRSGGVKAKGPDRTPPKPRRPVRPPRSRDGRPWWSLRGLSRGGWAWRIALALGVVFVFWAGLGFLALNGAVAEANGKVGPGVRGALNKPPGGMLGTPTNTLIIGSDARRGETRSRADTILIMRTDPDSGRIKYLSIPRDFRAAIPGHGDQKINAAFFFGGQKGMVRAVQRLTGLPIHHIIVIKFAGFPKLVDELGGVTVRNPTRLVRCPYSGGRTVSFARGTITLDGERALEFARVRGCDNDLERAQRQQALLAGMKSKVFSIGSLPRAPWRGASIARTLHTDIGTGDMVKLAWLQARLDQKPDDRILLTGSPQTIGGQSFIIGNPDANEREIARFVSGS